MKTLHKLNQATKLLFDKGESPLNELGKIIVHCLALVNENAHVRAQGKVDQKQYSVCFTESRASRPFLSSKLIREPAMFIDWWRKLENGIDPQRNTIRMNQEDVDKVLYTAMTSFSLCYDLWKPGSRKTPGTFLEVLLGSVMKRLLPEYKCGKFIKIPGEIERISTDLVFSTDDERAGIIIPAKITTRERIVQAFAHQRIADSVFGHGKYRSYLMCVSEMKRTEDSSVQEICVPGTIRLFQKHLAALSGIYYFDPPTRYLRKDVTTIVPVGTIGQFFCTELKKALH